LKAALQGHTEAIFRIAQILYFGEKIEEDVNTALKLFTYAKLAGEKHCDRFIELCRVEIQKKNRR
jgi:hypothetical protein